MNDKHTDAYGYFNVVVFPGSCDDAVPGETKSYNEYVLDTKIATYEYPYPLTDMNSIERYVLQRYQ